MKKFLLTAVCLLALTACSQVQQGKGTTTASSKQEATQTQKEQVQTKTFVSDLGDHYQNKIQIGYKKDEIVSMTIMGVAPIPEDMQKSDVAELKEVYQEEANKANSKHGVNGQAGINTSIKIADDKQTYTNVMHVDFTQMKKEDFVKLLADQGEETNTTMLKYLKGKPQDLFTYFKDQGLKEEKLKERVGQKSVIR